ncbi:MAG: flagellar biosynthesis protein FlhF [Nitrospirota bacterium]
MKIKTFKATTFSEALRLVKKELSENAVILSTQEKKGFRPSVEITAGIDYDAGHVPGTVSVTQASPREQAGQPALVDEIKSEIGNLRKTIESMKNRGYEVALPERKKMIMDFLRRQSVREEYALLICEKARNVEDIPLLIASDIRIKRQNGTRKAVMLIGPTGVGKTTTIAKLAAQAVKNRKRVAIVNLDTYRIGAVEQMRIYANILGIPLATASNTQELKEALEKFAKTRDVIFIDTTGRNPRDEQYVKGLEEACKAVDIPLELHLLMNANGDDAFMIESERAYRNLPIDYLGFSKIDEAVRYGPLYNVLLTYRKPVAYLTTGQRVPGDIEYPTVNRLASLILTKECASC